MSQLMSREVTFGGLLPLEWDFCLYRYVQAGSRVHLYDRYRAEAVGAWNFHTLRLTIFGALTLHSVCLCCTAYRYRQIFTFSDATLLDYRQAWWSYLLFKAIIFCVMGLKGRPAVIINGCKTSGMREILIIYRWCWLSMLQNYMSNLGYVLHRHLLYGSAALSASKIQGGQNGCEWQ